MMNMAIAHARQREQFGRPIGQFEMIQRKIAAAAADCYASDA
ncbi:MAG: acyl-CoA dehydrogenase family protein, partial [Gemmatimonadota bacterium]